MRLSPKNENQKQNQPSWVVKYRRNFKAASIIVLAVILVAGTAMTLLRKDSKKKSAEMIEAPAVLGSDMPGWWYKDNFGSSICDKESCKTDADPDSDHLTNGQEFYYHSDPLKSDTNGNGKDDGEDVANNIDPSKTGNVSFDQAASDDEIFGESLVFGEDIKKEVSDSINPNNVTIPLVDDSKLKIKDDNSIEVVTNYVTDVSRVIGKYFTKDQVAYIQGALEAGDTERLNDVKLRAAQVSSELLGIEVPKDFVALHKYTIAYFDELQIIIYVPDQTALTDEYNAFANRWYDSAQAFMAIMQRADIEARRLQSTYHLDTSQL